MTRDDYLPGPVDRNRIELVEDHELKYWTREFRCSAEQLLEAIESVGIEATAVGEFIAIRHAAGAVMPQYRGLAEARGSRRGMRDRNLP